MNAVLRAQGIALPDTIRSRRRRDSRPIPERWSSRRPRRSARPGCGASAVAAASTGFASGWMRAARRAPPAGRRPRLRDVRPCRLGRAERRHPCNRRREVWVTHGYTAAFAPLAGQPRLATRECIETETGDSLDAAADAGRLCRSGLRRGRRISVSFWPDAARGAEAPRGAEGAQRRPPDARPPRGRAVKRFARLFATLDETTRTNAKVAALAAYFTEAPERDRLWTIALLSGRRPQAQRHRRAAGGMGGRAGRRADAGCSRTAMPSSATWPRPSRWSCRPPSRASDQTPDPLDRPDPRPCRPWTSPTRKARGARRLGPAGAAGAVPVQQADHRRLPHGGQPEADDPRPVARHRHRRARPRASADGRLDARHAPALPRS